MKIVISDPKSGRSASMEIAADKSAALAGKRIGEQIEGSFIGMQGYRLKITGGSDTSGFPMDRSIQGTAKVKVLRLVSKSGKSSGQYRRRTVRGGIISDAAQVNMIIAEYGERPIDDIFGPPKVKEKGAAPPEKK
jgi:small subunit ribosomal protein S6e